jgi:hypothetical protein
VNFIGKEAIIDGKPEKRTGVPGEPEREEGKRGELF